MRIIPFKTVNDIEFGSSQELTVSILGEPEQKRKNSIGLIELHYSLVIYRYGDMGLEEASIDAPTLMLRDIKIPFCSLGSYLRKHDPDCFEKLGFIISPSNGIAYDPDYPSWVTAFPKSGVILWQSIGTQNA